MNLSIKDLISISHQQAHKFSGIPLTKKLNSVSSDSRNIKKGALFVALRGENFDGHDFIDTVHRNGAVAAIVDAKWYKKHPKTKLPCIVVKNTLDAFGELALVYRRKFSIPILAVGGSNGKTTTKDLLAHVLGTSFNVLKTEKNFNNQVGLPQMLFRLKPSHQMAVLEIGTNHPGEIAWLTNVAEPTHAIVTNIGREHLEFFKNLDGVAREELSALAITEELGGFGFLNWDDPYTRSFQEIFEEWSITYGTSRGADIVATSKGFDAKGRHVINVTAGKTTFNLRMQIIADYAPNMVAAAISVALHFNMKKGAVTKALESYRPHSKRMEVLRSKRGVTIINDAYNANPESFKSALATLAQMKTRGKKYVAAGDMFELGATSTREHRELGNVMDQHKLSRYFLTGTAMKHAQLALQKRKRPTLHASKDEIVKDLKALLKPGDILLVKGSRGMRMEYIVEQLV